MSTKSLAQILRLIRDGRAEERYTIEADQLDGGSTTATLAELKAADKRIAFDENPNDLLPYFREICLNGTNDGDEVYTSDNFDLEDAKSWLEKARIIYVINTAEADDIVLTEEDYEQLLKNPTKALTFKALLSDSGIYDVVIDLKAKTLAVGCQKYSISEWESDADGIIEGQFGYYNEDAAEEAKKMLSAALPLIKERIAREYPSPRRSRAKSAGRRSRRSSGRTRSRR